MARAGVVLGLALAVVCCSIGAGQAQDDTFEPPRAAFGILNIVRVDRPGLFPEPGSYVRKLYEDPRTIGDDTGEARSAEIARISASGLSAARLGSTLVIELYDRTVLKFFDDGLCRGFESCQRYTFSEYDAQRDYAIVDLSHGAGWEKILVWLRTGDCMVLPGKPMWAPSGNRFFSSGVIGPGGFWAAVVDMTGAKPKLESVDGWEPPCEAERWEGEAVVMNCGRLQGTVERVDGRWRLRQ